MGAHGWWRGLGVAGGDDAAARGLGEQELHAFVDGALDGRRYRAVVARLAGDAEAAARVGGYLRQQGELAALRAQLAELDPPADPVTAALTRELGQGVARQRRVRHLAGATALAASVLLAVVGFWGPSPGEMAQRLTAWRTVAEAGPRVLFGRDPLAGAAQLAAGAPALGVDEQLKAYAIRRPDLAAHGLRFVGGDALQGGEAPAIRLVYEDAAGRSVFLFVGTAGTGADVALTVVPEGHLSLTWRRGPVVFALIGPKDSDQLLAVMAATGELLAAPPAPELAVPDLATPDLAPAAPGAPALVAPDLAVPTPPDLLTPTAAKPL
jgi:anti-sigma factor RsiW